MHQRGNPLVFIDVLIHKPWYEMRTSKPWHTYAHTHSHLHMYMHACMHTDHPQHTTHTPHTHTSTPIYTYMQACMRERERESDRKRERARERGRTSVHTGFHSSLRMLRQTFPSCMHNNDRQQCHSKRIPYQNLTSQIYPQNFRGKKEVSPRRCLDGKPTDARKSQFR